MLAPPLARAPWGAGEGAGAGGEGATGGAGGVGAGGRGAGDVEKDTEGLLRPWGLRREGTYYCQCGAWGRSGDLTGVGPGTQAIPTTVGFHE